MIQRRRLRKRELAAAAVLLALAAAAAGSVRAHAAPLGPTRLYDSADVLHDTDTAPMTLETSGNPEYQNPKKAMLLSLLIPGLGEYSLGHRSRAYLFFGVEAATWITYATFHVQGADAKQSYKEWARLLAGVSERNDDNFYRTVGNYISSDGPFSANEQVRREARSRYPNDREAQEQYVQENGYFGSDAWTWESYDDLHRYQDMRSESLDAYNRADLTLAVLIATRLVSAVDSVILANKHNKGLESGDGASLHWQIDAGPEGAHAGLVMSRTF